MSISISYPASSLSSSSSTSKIQPFLVVERANDSTDDVYLAWDSGIRLFNPGYVKLYAVGEDYPFDYALVDKDADNIAPTLTYTQITAPTSGSLSDLNSQDRRGIITWNIPARTELDLFSFDLGAQKPVFIIVRATSYASDVDFILYGSSDNTNWDWLGAVAAASVGTYDLLVYGDGSYRYFKLSVNNRNISSAVDIMLNELGVWNTGNTIKTFNEPTITRLLALVYNVYYQVLELVYV